MTATQMRLRKGYWGIGVTLITFLVGAWLVVAPFALGNQRYSTSWTTTTTNDIGVGIGVMLISLVGFMLFAFSILDTLQAAGLLRPRPRPQTQALPAGAGFAPAASPYRDDYERTMTMLAIALATDLSERRARDNPILDMPVDARGRATNASERRATDRRRARDNSAPDAEGPTGQPSSRRTAS